MGALMVGIATVDIAYMVEQYPPEDSKATASDQILGAGGPAANAAVAFAALEGRSPTLLTALGRHPLASIAREDLSKHDVSIVDATPDFQYPPTLSSILISRSGLTRTIVSRDGADFHPRFTYRYTELLDTADIVLFDGHHPELASNLAPFAHARNIPIVLDIGRYKPVYDLLLPLADIAICSASFQPPEARTGEPDAILAYLHQRGVLHAAITNGPEPIRFSSGDATPSDMPISESVVVDTLAAGDTLHGAFCYYWLKTRSFEDSLAQASRIATESCQYFGPREWISVAKTCR
jgi:sugar/nucleoside kinase (ribokinase family)